MELFENGFVVAQVNKTDSLYKAWPLSDIENDPVAESLTNEADDNWFVKYDMQHFAPDINYAKRYYDYCKSINLDVQVLLFESLDNSIVCNEQLDIIEVLGYDCIGTVYHSYLQTEYGDFKAELDSENILRNKNRLFDKLEDVKLFIELRKRIIASGFALEDFWEETPVRISVVT
jgi:hypothetical protein